MARGSIFRRQGGYALRVDLGPDPATGKRRQYYKQGFPTKRAAEAALGQVLVDVREGSAVGRQSMSVATFLDDWLAGQRQRLKETTWSSYEVAVNRIKGGLGASKLKALAPLDIERFYSELGETGSRAGKPLSAKSVRNTHVVLRKALADAERLGRSRQASGGRDGRSIRRGTRTNSSSSSSTLPLTASSPLTSWRPPPACAEARYWASGGPTSTSTPASSPSARP